MIRLEIQQLDEKSNVKHIEFESFDDWDKVIGYLWKNFFIDNAWPSSEMDIRMKGHQIRTNTRVLLIIEEGV